uniref:G-protein coupled receptors family 1 profile domain-containing protein n=1 Tax=Plectus sambesii TaxID=2011161 RepID=A0A914X1C0_9BILA
MIFVVQGSVMCLGNGLIAATIASNKYLRRQKEILLMAGLAMADFVYGTATLLAGSLRIDMTLRGVISELVTPWDCMKWPPTALFTVGQQTVGLMMVIISVDRYIAVSRFSLYRTMGVAYAYKVLSLVVVYAATIVTALFAVSYFLTTRTANKTRLCVGPWAAPAWFGTIDSGLSSFYGYLSVAIYGAVYYKYRKHFQNSGISQLDVTRARQLATQRRVTVTVGIVAFFTFVFFCTPTAFVSLANYFGVTISSTVIYTLTRTNSIVHIFIYLIRQKDVRQAMISLITCSRASDMHNHAQNFVPSMRRQIVSTQISTNGGV